MSEDSSGVESNVPKKKGPFAFFSRLDTRKDRKKTPQKPINPEDVVFEQKKQEDLRNKALEENIEIGFVLKPQPPIEAKTGTIDSPQTVGGAVKKAKSKKGVRGNFENVWVQRHGKPPLKK